MTETKQRAARPPTPRWVKAFAIVGGLIVVLVILKVAGVIGEGHGPGRHFGMKHGTADIGSPGNPSAAARTIELSASDTVFAPTRIEVSKGQTITFSVTNRGQAIHEFTLGDEEMQREHAQMMKHIPAGMSHDTSNSITIAPGQTKQLTWRFADAMTVAFACHQPGHYEAGMRGQIVVV